MGRSEVSVTPSSLKEGVALSLPLKIAGLVFWGLAIIGLFIVVLAINWLEEKIPRYYDNVESQTYILTREFFEQLGEPSSPTNIKNSLKKIIVTTGAAGIQITSKKIGNVTVGNTSSELQVKIIHLPSMPALSPINELPNKNAILKIYQLPIKGILDKQKKQLITLLLVVLFSFGLILQWILKKLLTEPIQQMVNAAHDSSLGKDIRFNEKRNDEFGYLSRFINEALINLTIGQSELSYQATHDKLTGLYNRHEFDVRLNQFLGIAKNENVSSTLCYMDLDQFKIINDTCGHVAGDELLKQIAHALKSVLRESDFIARLGGDEFAVLLQGCVDENAIKIAKKLLKAVDHFHFCWEGQDFPIGVSIGVASITKDTTSSSDILSLADVACYTAKEKGRNQIHIYQANDKEAERKRGAMLWVSQIHHALENDTFSLYQQSINPVIPESQQKKHYEILLRIPNDDGTLISPVNVIGAAELYGLMTNIDEWVVRNTFEWMTKNKSVMQDIEFLSINLSGQSLSSKKFLNTVISLMDESNVSPENICFEITETSAISNFVSAIKFINTIKGLGCKFALDDFGSGMSSFSYLKNLNVDILKIDGSYVHNIENSTIDQAMVEAVNKIGHAMGMTTIAEYVENAGILEILKDIGVDFAQGYGIAYPAPLDDLIR